MRGLIGGLLQSGYVPDNTALDGANKGGTTDFVYTISNNYIRVNHATGYIMMTFQSVPLDDDGYPLVPDDASYQEALYWYITMKLLYPGWKNGQVRDSVYLDARRCWSYYCKQAYGNALMPDQGSLASIKNTWLSLMPRIDTDDAFSTLGEEQTIYNKSNRYYVRYNN